MSNNTLRFVGNIDEHSIDIRMNFTHLDKAAAIECIRRASSANPPMTLTFVDNDGIVFSINFAIAKVVKLRVW